MMCISRRIPSVSRPGRGQPDGGLASEHFLRRAWHHVLLASSLVGISCLSLVHAQDKSRELNLPAAETSQPAPETVLLNTVTVTDDNGHRLVLSHPASRIISLSPHFTAMLQGLGASHLLVGTTEEAAPTMAAASSSSATHLPRVGSAGRPDLTAMLVLNPDVLLASTDSLSPGALARLKAIPAPVYVARLQTPEDIARTLEKLGMLIARTESATMAAQDFRARRQVLQRRYAELPPIRVFVQLGIRPLLAIGSEHPLDEVIRDCGGSNIFANRHAGRATVSIEDVLVANPDVIIASGTRKTRPEWLEMWRHWPGLLANQQHNLYFLAPELIERLAQNLPEAAQRICERLDRVRNKRQSSAVDEAADSR